MKRMWLLLCGVLVTSAIPQSVLAQPAGTAVYDTVQVNGIGLAYQVIGQGEPLVMLHGFTGTGAIWELELPRRPQARRLPAGTTADRTPRGHD